MMKPRVVAFVPARSGSKRVPDKNIRPLGGHPLLAYSIGAALDSGVFDSVICVTDDARYAEIARHYGAEVPCLRPADISGDKSPDIEWLDWMLRLLVAQGRSFDAFSILRPTSPFRPPEAIRRAWQAFCVEEGADSLRAIEKCRQHPGKMWVLHGRRMLPLLPLSNRGTPWHSSQYADLPEVYAQDASLEIAWSKTVLEGGSIAGQAIVPFVSAGYDGFDINDPLDWALAEQLLASGEARLPQLPQASFPGGDGS